jgi:endonuclease-8
VPEGDTIWRTARTLQRAIGGRIVTRFETVLVKLARVDEDTPLSGRTVESVSAEGKWIVMRFSGGLILLTHMLMSGSWHIYRKGEKWQRPRFDMRIVIETAEWIAVAFRVPVAEFHTEETLVRRAGIGTLGPKVLAEGFDAGEAIANLRSRPELEIGVALLSQRLIAGLGNVFKSEVCFAAGIHPFRLVSSLNDEEMRGLVAAAVKLMKANITERSGDPIVTYFGMRSTTGRSEPWENLWVYHRTGLPCRKCGASIEWRKHAIDARSSFWCPQCQPMESEG